jgi:GAF domain-containing protein
MVETAHDFQKDINDIGRIAIVPTMLDVISSTTGMGFIAIARVTEDRWITCSSHDDLAFGLKPGDELEVKTTICNEIRDTGKAVVIDHVSEDPLFKCHHTPEMYGFQSYISVPIVRKDGSFFGTLCAIDPNPHHLTSPQVTGMFNLFADLISFHLNAIDEHNILEQKVEERTQQLKRNYAELEKMNKELQSFAYISSHDLQEPLRKIQML